MEKPRAGFHPIPPALLNSLQSADADQRREFEKERLRARMRAGGARASNADAMIANMTGPLVAASAARPRLVTPTPQAFIGRPAAAVQPRQTAPAQSAPATRPAQSTAQEKSALLQREKHGLLQGNPLGIEPTRVPSAYWEALRTCGGSDSAYPNTQAVYALLVSSGLARESLSGVWAMVNRSFPCLLTQAEFFAALALVAQLQAGRPPSLHGLQGPYPMPKLGSQAPAASQSSSPAVGRHQFPPPQSSEAALASRPASQAPQPPSAEPVPSETARAAAPAAQSRARASQPASWAPQGPALLDDAAADLNTSDEFGDFQAAPQVAAQPASLDASSLLSQTPLVPSQSFNGFADAPPGPVSYDALKELSAEPAHSLSPDSLSLRSDGREASQELSSPPPQDHPFGPTPGELGGSAAQAPVLGHNDDGAAGATSLSAPVSSQALPPALLDSLPASPAAVQSPPSTPTRAVPDASRGPSRLVSGAAASQGGLEETAPEAAANAEDPYAALRESAEAAEACGPATDEAEEEEERTEVWQRLHGAALSILQDARGLLGAADEGTLGEVLGTSEGGAYARGLAEARRLTLRLSQAAALWGPGRGEADGKVGSLMTRGRWARCWGRRRAVPTPGAWPRRGGSRSGSPRPLPSGDPAEGRRTPRLGLS